MRNYNIIVDDLYVKLLIKDFKDRESLIIDQFTIPYEEEIEILDNDGNYVETEVLQKIKYYVFSDKEYYVFHAGLARRVFTVLVDLGISVDMMNIQDYRHKTLPRKLSYKLDTRVTEDMSLRDDYQTPVVQTILEKRRGIIFVPTRGGKTEMLINAVQNYQAWENPKCKVTILVRKSTLAKNMGDRFKKRGFESVGYFGDGMKEYYKDVLVCIINSAHNLIKKKETDVRLRKEDQRMYDRITGTDVLLIDEIQDAAADMFQYVTHHIQHNNFPDLLIACSGTPYMKEVDPHSNIHDMNIIQHFGSVIIKVNDEYLIAKGYKARGNVVWMNYPMEPNSFKLRQYYLVYKKFITGNFARNALAANCVGQIIAKDKQVLVLVNRIPHGKTFLSLLGKFGNHKKYVFTSAELTLELGGQTPKPSTIKDPIKDFNEGKIDVLIGTNILNVGIDFPNCQWLVLLAGEGYDNDILNKQRTSRVLCPQVHDNNGYIIDFIDRHNPITMKHSRSRRVLYESANYNQFADPQKVFEFLNR